MKKFILIFFSLFSVSVNVLSETNFYHGIVITNQMDTLSGMLEMRSEIRNMRICRFKPKNSNQVVEYLPGEIYGYRFTDSGRFYVTKSLETETVQGTVFVEFMLQGASNLYYYNAGDHLSYFVEGADGKLYELRQQHREVQRESHNNIRSQNQQTYMKIDRQYIGTLAYAWRDSPEIRQDLSRVKYNHKSLISIAKRYHDYVCQDDEECIVFVRNQSLYTIKVLPYAAMHYANLNITNMSFVLASYSSLLDTDFSSSYIPEIGALLQFTNLRWGENISFQLGVGLSKVAFNGRNNMSSYLYQLDAVTLESLNLNTSLKMNYIFSGEKIRPLLTGGLFGDLVLSNKSEFIFMEVRGDDVNYVSSHPENMLPSFYGVTIGSGLMFPGFKNASHSLSVNYKYGMTRNKLFYTGGRDDRKYKTTVASIHGFVLGWNLLF